MECRLCNPENLQFHWILARSEWSASFECNNKRPHLTSSHLLTCTALLVFVRRELSATLGSHSRRHHDGIITLRLSPFRKLSQQHSTAMSEASYGNDLGPTAATTSQQSAHPQHIFRAQAMQGKLHTPSQRLRLRVVVLRTVNPCLAMAIHLSCLLHWSCSATFV